MVPVLTGSSELLPVAGFVRLKLLLVMRARFLKAGYGRSAAQDAALEL
jgi:hypothetical protein